MRRGRAVHVVPVWGVAPVRVRPPAREDRLASLAEGAAEAEALQVTGVGVEKEPADREGNKVNLGGNSSFHKAWHSGGGEPF